MFRKSLVILFILFYSVFSQAQNVESLVSADDIKVQLDLIKGNATNTNNETMLLSRNLEEALNFIQKTKKQENDIVNLEKKVKEAPNTLEHHQQEIKKLKDDIDNLSSLFVKANDAELENQQIQTNQQLQQNQTQLNEVSSSLASYRTALEFTRKQIAENNQQSEKLNRWKYNSKASKSLIDKYNAELKYLEANNRYNVLLGQNIDILIAIDESRKTELTLKQQFLQKKLSILQEKLNTLRIKEYEAQAKQAEEFQANNKIENPIIQNELVINTDLSQSLFTQIQKVNKLSQDDLRAKNVLETLIQTKRNIEEQISALQGTLVLSKVINQQKQLLPTANVVNNLAKDISKIRVELFELSQNRDELYNIDNAISTLESKNKVLFNNSEKNTLKNILQEREKILIDLIKTLNSQLNLSSEIETTQRQIIDLSDNLQNQLQQQSFWVQSTNPIDLTWIEDFPRAAIQELSELSKYIGFENIKQNLPSKFAFILFLLLFYGIILWKKTQIKERLLVLANQVNTLKNDSHWHTPEAMFWTLILTLPSNLLFLIISTIFLSIFFKNPLSTSVWITSVSGYWLFFATILALLRPNGIAYRHFGMPQASNEIFLRIIRQSIWIVVLLLVVSSLFSQIESIDFNNDVIGQVMTIIALVLCLVVIRPLLNKGIVEYQNAVLEDGTKRNVSLFKLLRLILFVAPISLIILIALGYYYTAVYIIEHIIKSYLVALVWVFGRYFAYRSLTISSRRMAYRRLQNKREKIREQAQQTPEQGKDITKEQKIKISTVNQQIFRMADLIAWVLLFASLYAIWSDLISIAYYLNGFILWEQVEVTSKGNIIETVTLLNILRSLMYITITYVLVKNIAGILEVTIFSRIKLSKGTPHTITAILTYLIVTIGSISAFTAIGISWSKIQWIFTALSVGLGFGVREIFGSFVSGTILLFERPIRVGDKVTVGNFSGIISKIRLRSTTLIDDEHKEVVLPNQAFVTDRFINWTLNNTITRLQIVMKINSSCNLTMARQLLMQAVDESPKVLKEPSASVNLVGFSDGAIEHELNVYVSELDDRAETRNFLYQRINELFKQHHIHIVFKQLDVNLLQPEDKVLIKG